MNIVISQIKIKLNSNTANDDKGESVKAYASVVINDSIKINGIRLESNFAGRLVVRFPSSNSRSLQYIVPLNNDVRQYIDNKIIERYFESKKAINKKTPTSKAPVSESPETPKTKAQEGIDENGN